MNASRTAAPAHVAVRGRRLSVRALPGAARRAKGFTLIEMIAAFVVFAIAVGALMQVLTMSLGATRRSLDETRAALWAQSMLDNVGIGERIEPGSTNGEFDRTYRWEMDIELIDPQLIEATAQTTMGDMPVASQVGNSGGASPVSELTQMELFHVELRVLWGDRMRERSARFSSLRLTLPDPAQGRQLGGTDNSSFGADRSGRRADGGARNASGGKQ